MGRHRSDQKLQSENDHFPGINAYCCVGGLVLVQIKKKLTVKPILTCAVQTTTTKLYDIIC